MHGGPKEGHEIELPEPLPGTLVTTVDVPPSLSVQELPIFARTIAEHRYELGHDSSGKPAYYHRGTT